MTDTNFDGLPRLPGTYQQWAVAFTRKCGERVVIPYSSKASAKRAAGFLREEQAAAGMTPDAALVVREVVCSEWATP